MSNRNVVENQAPGQTGALAQLLGADPVLAFLYRRASSGLNDAGPLADRIAEHLSRYLEQSSLGLPDAMRVYSAFVKAYEADVDGFLATGQYPAALTGEVRGIERSHYDVVLLISCLASAHRLVMMQLLESEIAAQNAGGGRMACVGCGPGLELALFGRDFGKVAAFDLSLNPCIKALVPFVEFHEESFPRPNESAEYDTILMIELLEHLPEPFGLLAEVRRWLKPEGRAYVTTAINVPQFDHLYNFSTDARDFELQANKLGFTTVRSHIIRHQYTAASHARALDAANHLFVLAPIGN